MNRLQLRYDTSEGISLRPFIDGQDVLADYRNDQGRDPDDLLPPLSTSLFPTREGRRAILGVCSCGESGCGSLEIAVRRIGAEVRWEPTEPSSDETLQRSYGFDLTQYLDAVDNAAGDPPLGEGAGRRVARAVRVMLGLYDQRYQTLTLFHKASIDWISAGLWTSDVVKASVSTAEGQTVYEFSARLGESEAELAARIAGELQELRMGRRAGPR